MRDWKKRSEYFAGWMNLLGEIAKHETAMIIFFFLLFTSLTVWNKYSLDNNIYYLSICGLFGIQIIWLKYLLKIKR